MVLWVDTRTTVPTPVVRGGNLCPGKASIGWLVLLALVAAGINAGCALSSQVRPDGEREPDGRPPFLEGELELSPEIGGPRSCAGTKEPIPAPAGVTGAS